MDTNCDSTTLEILRRIVGLQMQSVYAHRYPGYGAYDAVIATFGGGMTIRMDLRDHTISPKFEVFVLRVRPADLPTALNEWDHIELGDFLVASIAIHRRKEWLAGNESQSGARLPSDQYQSAIVDSGMSLRSKRGAEFILDSDSFPLVWQLHYKVEPTEPLESTSVPLDQYPPKQ